MDTSEYESQIVNGNRTDAVSQDVIEYLLETADFRVVERSALEKSDIDQSEFLSIALPSSNDYSEDQLIQIVKTKMESGEISDGQKFQFRHDGNVPTVVEIWKHGHGYSAFALSE